MYTYVLPFSGFWSRIAIVVIVYVPYFFQGFGLEYERYLREVVMALEEDETFRKKLEETNMTDIKVKSSAQQFQKKFDDS